jgi:uncharacterized membrane protein
MIGLGDLQGGNFSSAALDVSGIGSVIVGFGSSYSYDQEAFRWTLQGGMVGLGVLPGSDYSIATCISEDGQVIAGVSGNRPFIWTQGEGMVALSSYQGTVTDISADGSRMVGTSLSSGNDEAYFWSAETGIINIKEKLEQEGLDLSGWTLTRATGISGDGQTIVGYGINPQGQSEGWVVTLPEPTTVMILLLGIGCLRAFKI